MGKVIEVRLAIPGAIETAVCGAGLVVATLAGCGVAFFGYGVAFLTPPGGGVLRLALGASFIVFGLCGSAAGVYMFRGFLAPFFDRSVKLTLTDDELIDHREKGRWAVRWADVRRVAVRAVRVKGVDFPALISLTLEGGQAVEVAAVGLDAGVEAIRGLIDRHLCRAETAEPYMRCDQCDGERMRWEVLAGGAGKVRTVCPACRGAGMVPNPKHAAAAMATRPRCAGCGGLNPVGVKACYHCAAPLQA